MAVTKRGKSYHILFRPFDDKLVGIKTFATNKTEAREIELSILAACRTGDFGSLSPTSREACIRMFQNQGKGLPVGLSLANPRDGLTLWEAAELFLKYPEIRESKTRDRHEASLVNLVHNFGRDTALGSLRVPDVKRYMFDRRNQGAAEGTVNREKGTLSRLFQVMMEQELVDHNPVEKIKNFSEKSGQREVYLSFGHFQRIVELVPAWFRPIVQTAYYTGMRRGEILNLSRAQVSLKSRMIVLSAENTKEGHTKRIPIHGELIPVLKEALKVSLMNGDKVFLIGDDKRVHSPSKDSTKNPWRKAMKKLGLTDPRPRFHDLRHTWKTNARRSGVDFEIRESIMGHATRQRSVSERYGRISDEEFIRAVDMMTFDHGETEILVARRAGQGALARDVNRMLTSAHEKKKGRVAARPYS